MRMDDPAEYREGVVLDKPVKSHKKTGSYVNCGLQKVCHTALLLKCRECLSLSCVLETCDFVNISIIVQSAFSFCKHTSSIFLDHKNNVLQCSNVMHGFMHRLLT